MLWFSKLMLTTDGCCTMKKGDGPVRAREGPGGRQNPFGFFAKSTCLYRSAAAGVNGTSWPRLFMY